MLLQKVPRTKSAEKCFGLIWSRVMFSALSGNHLQNEMACKIFFPYNRMTNLDFKYRLIIDILLVMLNLDAGVTACQGYEGYTPLIKLIQGYAIFFETRETNRQTDERTYQNQKDGQKMPSIFYFKNVALNNQIYAEACFSIIFLVLNQLIL